MASSAATPEHDPLAGYVGNEACAKCHASIYETYSRSAMAHASGPASQDLITGEYQHQQTGVNYRIYSEGGKVWLSYERPGDPQVRGRRELLYYIGQGRRGRTYLFLTDGFLFESPVNWYSARHAWAMTPAYENTRELPLNLPALTSCMDCHVSGVRPPINGTENQYQLPVFAYSGITCERCHGPGAAHVNGGAIVNPQKLVAERRDQICMQCHLEGNVAIERAGKRLYEYRPGDDLFEYVRYYITSTGSPGAMRAASQFEALGQSACKRKSGASMSCTSCHDPHRSVSPEERVAYYRSKCLACHGSAFGAKHHAAQPDCTSCHMPANLSKDVAHTQVKDHRILARPGTQTANQMTNTWPTFQIIPYPDSKEAAHDVRDLALAWESVATKGASDAQSEATQWLKKAVTQSPSDPALLAGLGYAYQVKGQTKDAAELYERALKIDPTLLDAATNLGVIKAQKGDLQSAVELWTSAFRRAPGRSTIGIDLAHAYCAQGDSHNARETINRVLEFAPDSSHAKEMLRALNGKQGVCGR
jgi:predicted CXXCH cytochrome family protein